MGTDCAFSAVKCSIQTIIFVIFLQIFLFQRACIPGVAADTLHSVANDTLLKYEGINSTRKCGTINYLGCVGRKKFYYESVITLNWFDAWEYCRSLGLNLAAIENRYEQKFIDAYLPRSGETSYWTSGNDLGREGTFSWMATGRKFTFSNFRGSEPNNHGDNEHCVHINSLNSTSEYVWNDLICTWELHSLCQSDR